MSDPVCPVCRKGRAKTAKTCGVQACIDAFAAYLAPAKVVPRDLSRRPFAQPDAIPEKNDVESYAPPVRERTR